MRNIQTPAAQPMLPSVAPRARNNSRSLAGPRGVQEIIDGMLGHALDPESQAIFGPGAVSKQNEKRFTFFREATDQDAEALLVPLNGEP